MSEKRSGWGWTDYKKRTSVGGMQSFLLIILLLLAFILGSSLGQIVYLILSSLLNSHSRT